MPKKMFINLHSNQMLLRQEIWVDNSINSIIIILISTTSFRKKLFFKPNTPVVSSFKD